MASTNAPGGRFLPGDPRVEEPYRLTPQLAFRIAVLGFLALAIFAALFLRLWALQVLSGARYLAQANDNRVRTLSIQAPRGPVLDRSGHVLVRNVPGTRVELWPADLPKSWPAERRELRGLSMVTGVSVRDILAQLREHGSDPLTPDRRAVGAPLRPDLLPARARRVVPRRPARPELAAEVPVPVARGAGARLRRSDLTAGVQAPEEERIPADGHDRSSGNRVELRHLPPWARREGAVDGRLARPPEVVDPSAAAPAGRDAAPDARHRPATRGGAGVDLRNPPRAREPRRRARRRRGDRGAESARRLDPRDGVEPDLRAVGVLGSHGSVEARQGDRQAGRGRQLPGAESRNRRRLSAGLDLQARYGAGCDAGAADAAERPDPVHADVHEVPADVQQLDAADRPAHGPDQRARRVVRHVLLRARPPLLRVASEQRPPVAGVGEPVRPRPAHGRRRRARDRGTDADAGVAAQRHIPRARGTPRSIAPGSRAIRSSSRSARGSCSSRRCRWRGSTR